MATAPAYVYRLYDAQDLLLYIGRSKSPEARIARHQRATGGWQLLIDHWTIEEFSSASNAIRGQRRATLDERPLHADVTCDVVEQPVWVYRIVDVDGVLQYIGQTNNLQRRIWEHIDSNRFPVADYTAEKFSKRATAILAEREAIRTENPLHNRMIGGGSERRASFTFEQRVELSSQLREQLALREVTHRGAIEELTLAGYTIWRAADLLGLKTGWPRQRRTCPTLDSILALNGLT